MKVYATIFLVVVIFLGGLLAGYRLFGYRSQTPTITSQTIVTALKEQGFLVTQTFVANEQVAIKNDSGSLWKDFFWGQDITAFATMRVNSGIDLTAMTAGDVVLTDHAITVSLPAIENNSVEVVGDITLSNKQGILKRVFNNDDGYNQAYSALKEAAAAAATDPAVVSSAQQSAVNQIERMMKLVDRNRSVTVQFKH